MSSGRGERWRLGRRRRAQSPGGIGARRLTFVALGALVTVLVFAFAGGHAADVRAQPAPDQQPTLSIVNPKSVSGPVGTRVTVTISGAQKGQQFNLAYGDANGCTGTVTPISDAQTLTTGDSGTATTTFAWPESAGQVNSSYFVCGVNATGTAGQPVQSSAPFQVLSATAPSIDIQPAPTPTPTGVPAGSPVPSNTLPAGSYYAGGQIIVTGHNFLPGGTTVALYIASTQNGQGVQLTTDPNPINANTTGDFTATATLPQSPTGTLYIQAISTDGSNGAPPSLAAAAPIKVVLQPTPTPTPTATATPKPSPSATPGGHNGSNSNGDAGRTIGAAGLGGLSVILLIAGAWLLISAGRRPQG